MKTDAFNHKIFSAVRARSFAQIRFGFSRGRLYRASQGHLITDAIIKQRARLIPTENAVTDARDGAGKVDNVALKVSRGVVRNRATRYRLLRLFIGFENPTALSKKTNF